MTEFQRDMSKSDENELKTEGVKPKCFRNVKNPKGSRQRFGWKSEGTRLFHLEIRKGVTFENSDILT